MLNVMLSLILLIAVVNQVSKVTHLSVATKFQKQWLKPTTHAYHHLAEKMPNALNEMGWQDVHAFRHTLEMPIQLDVVRNVYSMLTVPVTWLASNSIVEILVEEFVDKTLNVLLSITYPFVHAKEVIKVIHLPAVE